MDYTPAPQRGFPGGVTDVEPKCQSAVVLRRVTDFSLEGFAGRQGRADTETAAVVIDEDSPH